MKTGLLLVLLLSLISLYESSLLATIGSFASGILRADILDVIDCILHNDIIIKDVNVIIDALLTKDINKIVIALTQVIRELIDEINKCRNPEANFLK